MKKNPLLRAIIALGFVSRLITWSPALAQETNAGTINLTIEPVQYTFIKGNVGKFEALNQMPKGYDGGLSNLAFVKGINKDISVELEARALPKSNDYKDELIVKDGDLAFLKINYKALRKYYDNTGGVYQDGGFTGSLSGVKAQTPALHLDINYLKLEVGLGKITDPDLDVMWEHNTNEGYKSLTMWSDATPSVGNLVKIGPSYEALHNTTDRLTMKEKKVIAGVTIKGQQTAEFDYNHRLSFNQFLSSQVNQPAQTPLLTHEAYPDTKLFLSGISGEKWMFNDKTFATLGYHYQHVHTTELTRDQELNANGVPANFADPNPNNILNNQFPVQSLWSYARNVEDQHVVYGNLNSNLTDNVNFVADVRYQYDDRNGTSRYLEDSNLAAGCQSTGCTPQATATSVDLSSTDRDNRTTGEHVALRYYGIPHTALYAEGDFKQDTNWVWQEMTFSGTPANNFSQEVLAKTQYNAWTVGARTVLNKYFSFTNQYRQHWESHNYNFLRGANQDLFLDGLQIQGQEVSSTLTFKPWRWFRNSIRYQFSDNTYLPRDAAEGNAVAQYNVSKNHMLSSIFTYEASLQPIDPVLLVFDYSHVEDYVKTIAGRVIGARTPTFNSGNNSFLFSASYTPTENVTWVNTAMYTLSNNYVDFSTGLPLGSSFKEMTLSTGIQWTIHKWLKVGPAYEYASYRDNPLAGSGNYSANIFKVDMSFKW